MPKAPALSIQPRKTPQQHRSIVTVEAIYDATIQVLLRRGVDSLTTVHVAARAGVSVGTLYQYFPNKQALLFAVLERHLLRTVQVVEETCAANHSQPLEQMVDQLVNRFIDTKLKDRETSVAFYRISSEGAGKLIVERTRRRFEAAIGAMLETARLPRSVDLDFTVHMIYLTMAGALRGHLERNAPAARTRQLREHLATLILAYLRAAETYPVARRQRA